MVLNNARELQEISIKVGRVIQNLEKTSMEMWEDFKVDIRTSPEYVDAVTALAKLRDVALGKYKTR